MVFHYLKSQFTKVKKALKKTKSLLSDRILDLFQGKVDEAKLEKLEEIFYEADLGVELASELTAKTKAYLRKNQDAKKEDILSFLKEEMLKLIQFPEESRLEKKPLVILIVGVNGNGKTTSCAKLGHLFKNAGKSVIFGAGDTFRAAAQEQIQLWANRLSIPLVMGKMKGDPSSVVFDTLTSAKAKEIDIAIIDTAGRLHTKTPLMQELEKIRRTCQKVIPDAPHETFLVLDATVGQNGIEQAKTFMQSTPLTGLILTKMDGTAKGGIVLRIYKELNIPVRFIGVGESIEDLEPFDPEQFIHSILD